ncbi:Superfamily II DNA or RNA helicase [Anaerovirgula multivorans]|uniref:Superfamily II DNA or RNA helicase n=1 Tax=Anaerovirgula multivorans TaxID=312168 RepID=A0A239I180_9FIRM|nr:DEAD/DEAH box helicase [Anaerovirgula multivorans]SNS87335.1 Superfamily II DNA or RNA helicase [Anaerovirgula multivorans]
MAENIISVEYQTTGKSIKVNNMGMREMQSRAYEARNAPYMLLKAPPASGKSRALMFIALDKLATHQVSKVIVAVPERSIGGSFKNTNLIEGGFHSNWEIDNQYNLCLPGGENSKVAMLGKFLDSDANKLVCTHATLRFAFDKLGAEKFNNCLVAIDEFHHVSANYESKLGELVRMLMDSTNAHIMAMTGSYFRGDGIPVLMPDDEAKFYKVTYNYYEQLNGYKYLKSLGIGFHFYHGRYMDAINEVLDTDKKTILHIPNVNSGESTKDKYIEVDTIIDSIGDIVNVDSETNIFYVKRPDGKIVKVADLVNDNPSEREKTVGFLRNIKSEDEVDLIIALGMAKEGFDWAFCEHALTVGYRGSLTEIIQIIGRCTRDSSNKTHAQFTNLIAEPDAENGEVVEAVNNMLKAIAASLLMEQVLAPNFNFKSRDNGENSEDDASSNTIRINGLRTSNTSRVKNILESDLTELKATILQDQEMVKSLSGVVDSDVVNKVLIPKIIMTKYPDLNEDEVETVREHLIADMVIRHSKIEVEGNKRFIKLTDKFINIEELSIDLIDSINPFQQAFEVISKSITPKVLKSIQECIAAFKVNMTDDEAIFLWPKINEFVKVTRRQPSLDALDPHERRLAEALVYLRQVKREQMKNE